MLLFLHFSIGFVKIKIETMIEIKNNSPINNNNERINIPNEKKIALRIKAWTELFSPASPDIRLSEAESVAMFSNFFELLSSVASAGLSIDDIFLPKNKEEEMFMEWFNAFQSHREDSFFDKYL